MPERGPVLNLQESLNNGDTMTSPDAQCVLRFTNGRLVLDVGDQSTTLTPTPPNPAAICTLDAIGDLVITTVPQYHSRTAGQNVVMLQVREDTLDAVLTRADGTVIWVNGQLVI